MVKACHFSLACNGDQPSDTMKEVNKTEDDDR